MAAPTDSTAALAWIREAMEARRYIVDPHLTRRLAERHVSFRSVWYAIKNAHSCTAYLPERPPLAGGTSWRVTGPDQDDEETSVGVETFLDHLGRRVLLITVF